MNYTKESLSEWVEEYTDDLFSWASHKISDTELARDLVQDTFLAAANKIESFKGNSSPKTWLFSILKHKIIDVYRKKSQQPIKMEQESLSGLFDEHGGWKTTTAPVNWYQDDTHLLDDPDFKLILANCMDGLPDTWGMSIKLKYLTDKDGKQICQELGITPSNFWQMIHRAKLQLRDCVDKNWFQKEL